MFVLVSRLLTLTPPEHGPSWQRACPGREGFRCPYVTVSDHCNTMSPKWWQCGSEWLVGRSSALHRAGISLSRQGACHAIVEAQGV